MVEMDLVTKAQRAIKNQERKTVKVVPLKEDKPPAPPRYPFLTGKEEQGK